MKRHYCTSCNRKRYENKMKLVWYNLIHNSFWHCLDCLSSAADISYSAQILKTKCIEITTIEKEGFSEMSGMILEIERFIKKYSAKYQIKYFFK